MSRVFGVVLLLSLLTHSSALAQDEPGRFQWSVDVHAAAAYDGSVASNGELQAFMVGGGATTFLGSLLHENPHASSPFGLLLGYRGSVDLLAMPTDDLMLTQRHEVSGALSLARRKEIRLGGGVMIGSLLGVGSAPGYTFHFEGRFLFGSTGLGFVLPVQIDVLRAAGESFLLMQAGVGLTWQSLR